MVRYYPILVLIDKVTSVFFTAAIETLQGKG